MSIVDVDIHPNRSTTVINRTNASFTHNVTNLGNLNDTINVKATSSGGWVVHLYHSNGTALTDTNSDFKLHDKVSTATGVTIESLNKET